jgi:hypothetical protein
MIVISKTTKTEIAILTTATVLGCIFLGYGTAKNADAASLNTSADSASPAAASDSSQSITGMPLSVSSECADHYYNCATTLVYADKGIESYVSFDYHGFDVTALTAVEALITKEINDGDKEGIELKLIEHKLPYDDAKVVLYFDSLAVDGMTYPR